MWSVRSNVSRVMRGQGYEGPGPIAIDIYITLVLYGIYRSLWSDYIINVGFCCVSLCEAQSACMAC